MSFHHIRRSECKLQRCNSGCCGYVWRLSCWLCGWAKIMEVKRFWMKGVAKSRCKGACGIAGLMWVSFGTIYCNYQISYWGIKYNTKRARQENYGAPPSDLRWLLHEEFRPDGVRASDCSRGDGNPDLGGILWLCHVASFPTSEACPLQWKRGVLTAGLPGKSEIQIFQ